MKTWVCPDCGMVVHSNERFLFFKKMRCPICDGMMHQKKKGEIEECQKKK